MSNNKKKVMSLQKMKIAKLGNGSKRQIKGGGGTPIGQDGGTDCKCSNGSGAVITNVDFDTVNTTTTN